jgi:predicted Zn-dependent protease
MAKYESYLAQAKLSDVAHLVPAGSPFAIEVRFLGGLTTTQKNAFKTAAERWARIIVGDLPSVMVDGEVIDDVLILAQGVKIDGPGKVLGQAGPTDLRPATAGAAAFLPAKGRMAFDTADLARMEKDGSLVDVITHEMGHVLGVGTVWTEKNLLKGAGSANPRFTGKRAVQEFRNLGGKGTAVPVENTGGPGTADSHWRDTVFKNELMTGFVAGAGNPISRITVGSLQDLGYVVDFAKAEPYTLPNLQNLAEKGLLLAAESPLEMGLMMRNIPIVLPEDALQPG